MSIQKTLPREFQRITNCLTYSGKMPICPLCNTRNMLFIEFKVFYTPDDKRGNIVANCSKCGNHHVFDLQNLEDETGAWFK